VEFFPAAEIILYLRQRFAFKQIIFMKYLAVLLLALLPFTANAQKFGYLNAMGVLMDMPEINTVNKQLEEYAGELEKELTTMVEKYQTMAKKFEEERANYSPTIRGLKEKELMDEQSKIQRTQAAFEEELEEKRTLLLQPLLEKVDAAIKAVAKEKSLSFVFDSSKGMLLFADESMDITNDVRKQLGLAPIAPGGNTAPAGGTPAAPRK
jgi:outer membrane protein